MEKRIDKFIADTEAAAAAITSNKWMTVARQSLSSVGVGGIRLMWDQLTSYSAKQMPARVALTSIRQSGGGEGIVASRLESEK